MLKKYIIANKKLGETPLETIEILKKNNPELTSETISYAGRLDPMAEGLLILLIGAENKKRKEYENVSKTYVVDILLGVSTDSYDLLGLINEVAIPLTNDRDNSIKEIHELKNLNTLTYPPYSSKPVHGKPLYYWARKDLLHTITLPQKKITITSVTLGEQREITGAEIAKYAIEHIQLVHGDFRQDEICKNWAVFAKEHATSIFYIIPVEITCSSGTYMRSLSNLIGEKIGIPTVAFSIKRTAIETWSSNDIYS
jgi:tRNA pseudouridine55 synthase